MNEWIKNATMVGENTFDISNYLLLKPNNPLEHLPVDDIILKFRSWVIFRQYTLQEE
jgi:hypothetical protein